MDEWQGEKLEGVMERWKRGEKKGHPRDIVTNKRRQHRKRRER